MLNNQSERKPYHKSPGRQYGYAYNPLQNTGRTETSLSNEAWQSTDGVNRPSRPGAVHSTRPDPRRTRQLLRQQILASKSQSAVLDRPREIDDYEPEDELASTLPAPRRHGAAPARGYHPRRFQEFEEQQIAADWIRHGESMPDYMDSELSDTEDPLAERVRETQPRTRAGAHPTRVLPEEDEDEDERLDAELREKKRQDTRRKFLISALVLGGAGVAAAEILPRLPQAIGAGASNLEHQVQQAFQNGVNAGAAAARKDLLNGLDDLEGFSLEAAIEAAKLTRVAYDVFVSPLVTLAANVADDFLVVTLDALINGRKWLAQINEDSPTLAALQAVLQNWVNQVHEMPKTVQTITETDLDGAQAYLRALQRKIQAEQAQLNKK